MLDFVSTSLFQACFAACILSGIDWAIYNLDNLARCHHQKSQTRKKQVKNNIGDSSIFTLTYATDGF
jgi:hypothetical protein